MNDTRADEELNRIIAEWMGWTFHPESSPREPELYEPEHWTDQTGASFNSFFCEDLNAVQFVVSTLKEGYLIRYVNALWDICTPNPAVSLIHVIEAKPRQRAEALVRVIEESMQEPPPHLEPELIGRNGHRAGDI